MKDIVLYCGMADDILTPFLLIPNLKTLYVIDKFDRAFSKDRTLEGQHREIVSILKAGNDQNSFHRYICLKYNDDATVTNLVHELII
jgi:hypothetical protein